jgi:hypothetical protein
MINPRPGDGGRERANSSLLFVQQRFTPENDQRESAMEKKEQVVGLAETLSTIWPFLELLLLLALVVAFIVLWRWWRRFWRPGHLGEADPSMGAVDLHNVGVPGITGGDRVGLLELTDIVCGKTYFVTCSAQKIGCEHGLPFLDVVQDAYDCAMQRALQVSAACQVSHPDCRGIISVQFMEWACRDQQAIVNIPNNPPINALVKMRYAIVQVRVSCAREF